MSILGVPVRSLGGGEIQVNDNIYDITPEIHKSLSLTTYTGRSMKNENDQRTLKKFLVDVGYTGDGAKKSIKRNFLPDFSILLKIIEKKSLIFQKVKE